MRVQTLTYLLNDVPHFRIIIDEVVLPRPSFFGIVIQPVIGLSRSLGDRNRRRRVDVGCGKKARGQGGNNVAGSAEGLMWEKGGSESRRERGAGRRRRDRGAGSRVGKVIKPGLKKTRFLLPGFFGFLNGF